MSKQQLTYKKMLGYLKNLFSNSQRHALEKKVMQDPFEAEAFEGLSELSAVELEGDMNKLKSQLSNRTQKRKNVFWNQRYAIAASVLFLVGLGLTVVTLNKVNELYQIVKNTPQQVKDVVVINDSKIDQETVEEELFREPDMDFSKREESAVAYEAIEDDIPTGKKAKLSIEKPDTELPSYSRRLPPEPDKESIANSEQEELVKKESTPAKTVIAAAEVIANKEVEVFDEVETELGIVRSKEETTMATEEFKETETWSGIIMDNYGMPLSGVSVVVKDNDTGTVTDFDGNYTLQVPKGAKVEANFLGFENANIVYGSHQKIIMDEDTAALEEVMVVGYGASKKRSVTTSSVEKTNSGDLSKKSKVRLDEALSGRVAGVNISTDNKAEEFITIVAVAPQGNDSGFKRWIMSHLDPSEFEKEKEYSIEVSFVIDEKGNLTGFKTKGDLKNSEKKHLKNTVLSSSNWTPAQNKNGTIKQSKTLVLWFHF